VFDLYLGRRAYENLKSTKHNAHKTECSPIPDAQHVEETEQMFILS
jgi:hypothetical protein